MKTSRYFYITLLYLLFNNNNYNNRNILYNKNTHSNYEFCDNSEQKNTCFGSPSPYPCRIKGTMNKINCTSNESMKHNPQSHLEELM